MKHILLTFILSVLVTPAMASPVVSTACDLGGEFGHVLVFELARQVEYKSLTIHRQKEGSDYLRDLTSFHGGKFRLDLNPQGGILGYTLEYKSQSDADYQVMKGELSCGVEASDQSQAQVEDSNQDQAKDQKEDSQKYSF